MSKGRMERPPLDSYPRSMAVTALFVCPETGMQVEGRLAEPLHKHTHASYEAVECPSCRGIHLVNPPTGRTLDAKASDAQSPMLQMPMHHQAVEQQHLVQQQQARCKPDSKD